MLTKDRSGLIGNETEPDFSVWVDKIKAIKIIGEQKIIADYESQIDEKTGEILPAPKKAEPTISTKTGEVLFAVWDEMWNLYCEKKPEELDSTGQLRYTKDKSESTRLKTISNKFKVDSSTKLTEKQALEFIDLCKSKIKELSDVEPEAKEEEPKKAKTKKKTAEPEVQSQVEAEEEHQIAEFATEKGSIPTAEEIKEPAFGE